MGKCFENTDDPSGDDGGVFRRSYLEWASVTGIGLSAGGFGARVLGSKATGRREAVSTSDESGEEVLIGVERTIDQPGAVVRQYVPGDAEVVHENSRISYATVRFPEQAERAARDFVERVVERPDIRYAEPNRTYSLQYTPSDPEFSDQDAAKMVNADDAWDLTFGSSDVTIAVIDQGVKYDHPDLSANMSDSVSYHGKDFVDDDSDPYPVDMAKEYHGTHVAGIAAAEIDNGTGVAGISNASILSGRVADQNHDATASDLADGISWAAVEGADVINVSLGGASSSAVKDAVEYAHQEGSLVVAAAGNGNSDSVDYPAAYDEVVAVTALTADGAIAPYSNVGDEVELAAPGTAVISTASTDGYALYSGTSMATPIVSGVAALALSRHSFTNEELREHLRQTAVDMGLPSQQQGYGRVDAYQAVANEPDTTVIDDFEDGDLSEYSGASSSSWSAVDTISFDGSYAAANASNHEAIYNNSYTYQRGDAIEMRAYLESANGVSTGVEFWTCTNADASKKYVQYVSAEDDEHYLVYRNGVDQLVIDSENLSVSSNEWLRLRTTSDDSTVTARLYDSDGKLLSSLSGSNSERSSGGYGFRDEWRDEGPVVYVDTIRG